MNKLLKEHFMRNFDETLHFDTLCTTKALIPKAAFTGSTIIT